MGTRLDQPGLDSDSLAGEDISPTRRQVDRSSSGLSGSFQELERVQYLLDRRRERLGSEAHRHPGRQVERVLGVGDHDVPLHDRLAAGLGLVSDSGGRTATDREVGTARCVGGGPLVGQAVNRGDRVGRRPVTPPGEQKEDAARAFAQTVRALGGGCRGRSKGGQKRQWWRRVENA